MLLVDIEMYTRLKLGLGLYFLSDYFWAHFFSLELIYISKGQFNTYKI